MPVEQRVLKSPNKAVVTIAAILLFLPNFLLS
jgi:hypothetical protein